MSSPAGLLALPPVALLWWASGSALSLPALVMAAGIFIVITLSCLIAGRIQSGREVHRDTPAPE